MTNISDNILVSIIIPNYNNQKYIAQCLDSCISQKYENIEILVVDDCSTDGSADIATAYMGKDKRIKVIFNEYNQGVSRARNAGIENASGDWVTTLDSDDFYTTNDKIGAEVRLLKQHNFNENVMAYSGIVLVNESGSFVKNVMHLGNVKEGNIFESILTRDCAIPRDFIFAKSLYYKVSGFDPNISIYEDWDFKIRLSKVAQFFFTGIDAIGYRRHDCGLSSASVERLNERLYFVFDKNSVNLKDRARYRKALTQNVKSTVLGKIRNKLYKIWCR